MLPNFQTPCLLATRQCDLKKQRSEMVQDFHVANCVLSTCQFELFYCWMSFTWEKRKTLSEQWLWTHHLYPFCEDSNWSNGDFSNHSSTKDLVFFGFLYQRSHFMVFHGSKQSLRWSHFSHYFLISLFCYFFKGLYFRELWFLSFCMYENYKIRKEYDPNILGKTWKLYFSCP